MSNLRFVTYISLLSMRKYPFFKILTKVWRLFSSGIAFWHATFNLLTKFDPLLLLNKYSYFYSLRISVHSIWHLPIKLMCCLASAMILVREEFIRWTSLWHHCLLKYVYIAVRVGPVQGQQGLLQKFFTRQTTFNLPAVFYGYFLFNENV